MGNPCEVSMSDERAELLKLLSDEELDLFTLTGGLDIEMADQMRENVIGITKIPIGVAENFIINGKMAHMKGTLWLLTLVVMVNS